MQTSTGIERMKTDDRKEAWRESATTNHGIFPPPNMKFFEFIFLRSKKPNKTPTKVEVDRNKEKTKKSTQVNWLSICNSKSQIHREN